MKLYIVAILTVAMLLLSACGGAQAATDAVSRAAENSTEPVQDASDSLLSALDYPAQEFPDAYDDAILMEDEEVAITQSGAYELTGNYSEIVVNVNKDTDNGVVYLVLNNAHVESETGTPIHIVEAENVVLVLEGENVIKQGAVETQDTEFPSAAVYSAADTTITGTGTLNLSTLYQDGINSRDDLIIEGATLIVSAVEDGIVGKDLLAISGSDITVECGKDGLKASNDEDIDRGNLLVTSGNFAITAQNDAISAEQLLQIEGGDFNLFSGGGYVEVLNEITVGEGPGDLTQPTDLLEDSMKGIKANDILISGGAFVISSYEDAVHANNNLTIDFGSFVISSGDDALHADEYLTINDGDIRVENAYEGLEGSFVIINKGTINANVLDDAINANADDGFVQITGGNISLKCQGDGIDSNGDLIIEGGDIVIEANSIYAGGDGELDVTGVYSISGGSITDENGNPVEVMSQGAGGGPPRR